MIPGKIWAIWVFKQLKIIALTGRVYVIYLKIDPIYIYRINELYQYFLFLIK